MTQEIPFPEALSVRYQDARLIGAGGTSRVFAAFDRNLKKNVAIKILISTASSQTVLRFQQEAKVISKLKHPNIVGALDFALNDEVQPYMVMELMGDETLSVLIKQNRKVGLRNLLGLFIQVCSAMSYAHSQGVLHRDLKPGNVLIEWIDGIELKAKVADFGVAKIAGTQVLATTGNIIIGTPAYMSPEQFHRSEVDVRSDIYSFGCLMYETLEGRLPFLAEHISELALCHANEPIPPINGTGLDPIPSILKELVYRCLAKLPEDRFESFAQIEEVLKEIRGPNIEVAKVWSRHISSSESGSDTHNFVKLHWPGGGKGKLIISVTALLIVFAGARIYFNLSRGLEPSPDPSPAFSVNEPSVFGTAKPHPYRPMESSALPRAGQGVKLPSGGGPDRFILPESARKGSNAELLAKARLDYDDKQFLRAEDYLKTILARSPDEFDALVLRSDTRRELALLDGALVDITNALKLRPEQTKLLSKRAVLRRATGDFNGALDDMNELIQHYPNDAKAFLGRAQLHEIMKSRKDALEDYTTACELNRGDEAAWLGRARMHQELKDNDRAVSELSTAIAINDRNADSFYLRGNSYNAIGKYKEAIDDFNSAIKLNGDVMSYYSSRAVALRNNGQEPLARIDEMRVETKDRLIK